MGGFRAGFGGGLVGWIVLVKGPGGSFGGLFGVLAFVETGVSVFDLRTRDVSFVVGGGGSG